MIRILACALALVAGAAGLAGAGNTAGAAAAVVLVPLDTLGSHKPARSTQSTVARALASVPGVKLVAARRIQKALDRKPTLRTCDGALPCLVELGRDLGARYVVHGEVGGLGEVEIVYLKVIDVARGSELRSTTAELTGDQAATQARAAAFRLLAPRRYVGTLAVAVDVAGAAIYVDGTLAARSPARPLVLSVGTHALRVTHPEFRDFVRFVDVVFDQPGEIRVGLQTYPTVTSDLAPDGQTGGLGGNLLHGDVEPTPWYRRWYTVAGVSAALLVTSALVVGVLVDGIDADRVIDVNRP